MIGKTISHYRILQKLGEGGMGVVYKAEDVKLERFVALKFLSSHLNEYEEDKQRFIHEAKAASSLDHPNICTIYEIDRTEDGRLFVAMAYYEGKTLKEKIDSGPVKIIESINISIQISRGLLKAHEKGIIHRDIKPSNIFITTDGVVKIIDFGLAKLSGKTQLTKEGTKLGTVNFMSPEQVKGGEIDHRTDIWALGVVIYIMLTGQQPFRGDYDQAILYSILNEEPEPITGLRTGVSIELERIINKALAKNPDERYQHIDDLLADVKKEQKNLANTVKVNNNSPEKRSPEKANSRTQISSTQSKSFKFRKIIIALSVITLLLLVYFIFNPYKIPKRQNSELSNAGKSLAVMYFENIPDPEDKDHTGEMLTNLLITSLSQVKGLEVISRERLLEIQKEMGNVDAKNLSPSLAEQIADQAGVNTMLIGSILQKNPKLAVTTRLIDVKSGRIISSNKVINFSVNQIFNLVDSLTYLLRQNFQTSPLPEIKAVSEVTTVSPEAYRAYVEGVDLYNRLFIREANTAFKRAAELDTNFAMAYYYLSIIQGYMGNIQGSWKSIQKSVKLINNTTERERLQILAASYLQQNNPGKTAEILEKLASQYPHEIQVYLSLGLYVYIYQMLEPQKSIEVLKHGLKINPTSKHLWNALAYSLSYLNRKNDAINAINEYIKLAPAEPNPYDTKGDIYSYFMEYDSSRIEYKKSFGFRKGFSAEKLGFYYILRQEYKEAEQYFKLSDYEIQGFVFGLNIPWIDIHQGKLHIALNKLKNFLKSKISQSDRWYVLGQMVHLYYETRQYPEMLRAAKELSNSLKTNPGDKIHGRNYLAWALVKNSRIDEAHKLLNNMQKDVSAEAPRLQIISNYSSALISFEEDNYNLSLKSFKNMYAILPPNRSPNIFFAITLIKNKKISEAIAELKRLLYWPPSGEFLQGAISEQDIEYWPVPAVKAHYWLGIGYEKQGKNDKAIEEYEKFVNIWKDADFKSTELNDAKKRIVKLKQRSMN